MVRMRVPVNPTDDLAAALQSAYPELDAVREAAEAPVHLVGGAVRDLILGRGRSDIDLVVEGDAAALAAKLGAEVVEHERFATAKVRLDGHEVDIATARAESYPRPGALPEIEPAPDLAGDLRRRDFTINAMAIPLQGEPRLVDPYGGRDDLEAGLLRVLHAASLVDDPTRAVRAARYVARFGFEPEPDTERLLRAADLSTVSADRREAGLMQLAAEPNAARGFALLADCELIEPLENGIELAARVEELLSAPPWSQVAPRPRALLAAVLGPRGAADELAAARPARPSEAVELARGSGPVDLVLARALGGEWLDRYVSEWRSVRLEIDGRDLIAAGVAEGPALGRGLATALRRKLDGEISGRGQELEAALEGARGSDGVA
jgi:tRNA nucleotidyltransferase (CCA-adding enzyme)